MACLEPTVVGRDKNGKVVFREMPEATLFRLPCMRCLGCRQDYARGWKIRAIHEAKKFGYSNCSFVTLTYDDEHLPENSSLHYADVQKFLRRLRKTTKKKVRFICAGEYGPSGDRPHYHVLLFGETFEHERNYGRCGHTDNPEFGCDRLDKLWGNGAAQWSNVNDSSIAYVAGYAMKKVYGRVASQFHYNRFDASTGEILERKPEFIQMSRKPGIGHDFFDKYGRQWLRHGYVLIDGVKYPLPRYYKQKGLDKYPELVAALSDRMTEHLATIPQHEFSPERMAAKKLNKELVYAKFRKPRKGVK